MEKVLCLRRFYRCIRQVNVFCPAKRQSTGQVVTSEYHSRRASPVNNKKASQVRYNLTRFAGSPRLSIL